MLPQSRLRQMCPALAAYVKEDCCTRTLGSTQLKPSAGPVARTPHFHTHLPAHLHHLHLHQLHHPPTCPPASTSTTSTASTTCPPHPPPTLLPPPRPARPSSYSLPAYNTRRGGPGLGRRPAPAPPPAPLIKSPATDLATLDAIPIDHRKRSFSSPTSFLHRLLLSVPCQPDRPHDCMLLRLHHRTRSTALTPPSFIAQLCLAAMCPTGDYAPSE